MARLGFIGDVYPGTGSPVRIDPEVRRHLTGVDLLVANLEGPLTDSTGDPAAKGVHLRSAPDRTAQLVEMGIGIAVLANNHMFDYAHQGWADTVESLDAAGIDHLGAGADLTAATRPLVRRVDGLTIGFLAYSAREIETVCATEDAPGCAPLELDLIRDGLESLQRDVEVTVLFLHWGLMGYELPTPDQERLGRTLLDLGPTLVVGCHPHVVQGVVSRGSQLLAHSLGDFAFQNVTADGRAVDQHRVRQTGMLLTVDVGREGVRSHEVLLTRQQGLDVALETSSSRERAVGRASARIAGAPENYGKVWRRYVWRRTGRRMARRLAPWRWRTLSRGAVRGFRIALRELRRR